MTLSTRGTRPGSGGTVTLRRNGPISPPNNRARHIIEQLLDGSGITLNGSAPHDIRIFHPDLLSRVLRHGTLGLGEAYMDGWGNANVSTILPALLFAMGWVIGRIRPPSAFCAGAFRSRHLQLWQTVYFRYRQGRYDAPR